MTVLCGSLSLHPVSLGAVMHRAGYAARGLDYAYQPFRVANLQGAITGMRALGIRGFGVSMPYKIDVMQWLDVIDPLAQRIGAVNTIVNDDGRLTGYNTDAAGARRALEEALPLAGLRVTVIGAGGAARAVVFALAEAGARVHIANRTPSRGEALARSVGSSAPSAISSSGLDVSPPEADVLVNASSAGMEGVSSGMAVPEVWLSGPGVVMDIVYKPIRTALISAARRLGKTTVHGGRMLLHQAAAQFELYTHCSAPLDAMDLALRRAVSDDST